MSLMNITFRGNRARPKRIRIELDAAQFERLAANLGLFSPAFLASVDRAEREVATGKAKRLHSLRELRRA